MYYKLVPRVYVYNKNINCIILADIQRNTFLMLQKLTGHHNVVTGIKFDQWHIVTGSKDGYALAWSAQGDHTRCLTALRHTRYDGSDIDTSDRIYGNM